MTERKTEYTTLDRRPAVQLGRRLASPAGVVITLPLLVLAVGFVIMVVGRDATTNATKTMARRQLAEQARSVQAEVAFALDQGDPLMNLVRVLADRSRPLDDVLVRLHDVMAGRPGIAFVSISFPDGTSRGAQLMPDQQIQVQESTIEPHEVRWIASHFRASVAARSTTTEIRTGRPLVPRHPAWTNSDRTRTDSIGMPVAALSGMRNVILPLVLLAGASAAAAPASLTVKSTAFSNGGAIPADFTCEGAGMAPPISWSTAPAGTQSIALVVDDPDAPKGDFTHLFITGISPTTTSIDRGEAPRGALSQLNDTGKGGYTPPCPPNGTHHYHFRVYALDIKLPMAMTRADLDVQMRGHILAQGELVGTYEKRGTKFSPRARQSTAPRR